MVEFIREPAHVEVRDPQPEFSWIAEPQTRQQTAYRIQVSTSEASLDNDDPDTWDSGKVMSGESTEIEYGGENLPSGGTWYWRVMTWDEEDRPGPYSAIQSFRTGIVPRYATTPNVFETALIEPTRQQEIGPGHRFFDFGKAAFGTLVLKVSTEQPDTLTVHLGEKLTGARAIDRTPPGSVRYQKVQQPVDPGQDEYLLQLPPDERNTNELAIALPDSFPVIMPFRYCEIEYPEQGIRIESIRQKAFFYYFDEDASFFSSSDTLLNQVWDLCKYSMKATSFTGYYVDGDRERIPYEADALINQLGHYNTDREYSMARRTNEYFIDHPTWPTEWILQTIMLFYYDYMYTGNDESMRHFYPQLKHKTLTELAREDGLISTYSDKLTNDLMAKLGFSNPEERIRDIVDWPPSQEESDREYASVYGERDNYDMVAVNTVVNSFHFYALKLMSEIAGVLGEEKDSVLYRQQAGLVKSSINEKLLDHEKGIYIDGEGSDHSSLHANMMPLAFGLVPEAYQHPVVEFIKSRGMACSVYGSQFLLDGLYEAGEGEYALSLMTATHDRSWWNMIRVGSTISMEAWDMKYKPNADWNHAWGAAPANIIPRHLWGIQPLEPGFKRVVVRPQLAGLTDSRIKVPTIKGFITAEFTRGDDGRRRFSIELPGNMVGEFRILETDIEQLRVDGQEEDPTEKTVSLKPGMTRIELTP